MAAIARLEHVTFTFPGASTPALRDVSLEIGPAEVILVLGSSGSGKSTLLKAITGLVPHHPRRYVRRPGDWWTSSTPAARDPRISAASAWCSRTPRARR